MPVVTLDELRRAVQEQCKKRDWSVMDLAQRSEVSPEAIRRLVSGGASLRPATIMRVARALGIDYTR
jgi:plasmid maintenance system antidote protein VapI